MVATSAASIRIGIGPRACARDGNVSEDVLIRQSAFDFLDSLTLRFGELLPRSELQRGFGFRGRRVPLVGPEGIFKPAALHEYPLSITSAPPKPGREPRYRDELSTDGFLRYRYRGTNPQHPDNVGLRRCIAAEIPLVYFYGVVPGKYLAQWPIRIVGDDPESLTFLVSLEEGALLPRGIREGPEESDQGLRRYRTIETQQRLHQRGFRERVLIAYGRLCAVCRLRHDELLDAAHIIADSDPRGAPVVPNGIALCKLHHAAFDGNVIGIRPDYVVVVRADVLGEEDGPMLLHGLQRVHESTINVPRSKQLRPKPEFLEERFDAFRRAS
jgi:putative restriction endonuclease